MDSSVRIQVKLIFQISNLFFNPQSLLIPTLCGLLEWNPMIARRVFWIIEFPAVWQFTLSEKACKQIFSSICPPLSKAFAQSTQPLSRANPLCCPFVKCSSPTVLLLCQGCKVPLYCSFVMRSNLGRFTPSIGPPWSPKPLLLGAGRSPLLSFTIGEECVNTTWHGLFGKRNIYFTIAIRD